MDCLFLWVLHTFRMTAYFGNEEQITIFPVASQPNFIGHEGKIMHLNIKDNGISPRLFN